MTTLSLLPRVYKKKGRVELLEEAQNYIRKIQQKQKLLPEERAKAIACFREVTERAMLIETKNEFTVALRLVEDDSWWNQWFT